MNCSPGSAIAPLTAAAGNPDLKPYRSVNFDASAEYYFDPQSVVALSGFYKNVLNYVVNEQEYAFIYLVSQIGEGG